MLTHVHVYTELFHSSDLLVFALLAPFFVHFHGFFSLFFWFFHMPFFFCLPFSSLFLFLPISYHRLSFSC